MYNTMHQSNTQNGTVYKIYSSLQLEFTLILHNKCELCIAEQFYSQLQNFKRLYGVTVYLLYTP